MAARSAAGSEASTPTDQTGRPRSTTLPGKQTAGEGAAAADSAAMPPPHSRAASEWSAGGREGREGRDEQRSGAAADSTASPLPTHSNSHTTSALTQPLQIITAPSARSSSGAGSAVTGIVGAGPLLGAAEPEQPSSARSDSAALWPNRGRTASGVERSSSTATSADRGVSLSQPVSPAKLRGRSLLLQTLPAQLFSPTQPPHSTTTKSFGPSDTADLLPATPISYSQPVRTSATASASGAASSTSAATPLPAWVSATPPSVALSAPPASAAAVSLSPERLHISPGLSHIMQLTARRKEMENDRRRREEQQEERDEGARAAQQLHSGESVRAALSMEELQPRLIALQAERKEAEDERTAGQQQQTATDSGTREGEQRDTEQVDGALRAHPAEAAAAAVRRDDKAAAEQSTDAGLSLPVLLGGLLLIGASAYGSWLWYQRQKRRLGVRR